MTSSLSATTIPATVDLNDIQGMVRFGYKHLTEACFVLLRTKDREAARAWLATVPVSSAATMEPTPDTALQVAVSCEGLRALSVPEDIVGAFSPEFVSGLGQDANRARRLGDVGTNAPDQWLWGTGSRVPHVLVLLYASPGRLAALQQAVEAQCAAGFDILACLPTTDMNGVEPFGFADGISQPQLDWERQRAVRDQEQQTYANRSCLGEYLLGYPNEYGGYTDRPMLDPQRDGAALLPRAEDAPDRADLGRNGSYLVMRQLRQNVHGFWQFVDAQAGANASARERLAAAMVGRTLAGVPVVEAAGASPTASDATPDLNAFDFRSDPRGVRCPLGAHVRRTNPRNADLPPGRPGIFSWLMRTLGLDAAALEQDCVASTRFHRVLRRGREFGSPVSLDEALRGTANDDGPGLHFICLGANIVRQFEFVQGAWVAGTHFDRLHNESDPLLGSHQPALDGAATDGFSMPQSEGPDQRLDGLPQFVTVVGGAYFFLPGIRALRYLTTAR